MIAPSSSMPRWLYAVLAIVVLAAVAVPIILVRNAPHVPPAFKKVARPTRVVPKQELPPVEPVALQELAPQDAREYNATIPFSTAPNPPARPFILTGSVDSQLRAIDCLAAAVIYEAGDDASGERAVAQVVLNRTRHPAFPKSICGVVFQGQERRTGCQFTFTCDGAMLRNVNAAAWQRARDIATAALNGRVDKRVGQATHYHTDWVVPYWSASLDKITEVNTHLFFRWTGWWGTPPAFTGRYAGVEPNISKLARLSPAHIALAGTDAALATAALPLPADLVLPPGLATPGGVTTEQNSFLVTIDPKLAPEQLPALAERACGDRPYCKFMAWNSKAATPANLPVTPAQQRAMSFSFLRDRTYGFEKSLWNCAEFARADKRQCMKADLTLTLNPVTPTADAVASPPTVPTLTGVRRKSEAAPTPTPTPTPALRVVPTAPRPQPTPPAR